MSIIISSNYKKHYKTYIDFVDHYWINYFKLKKKTFFSVPNIKSFKISSLKNEIKLIILPGGNNLFSKDKISKTRLKVEFDLIKYALKKNVPILGICRGMQVINFFFKGSQKRIRGHMRTRHKIFFKNKIFNKKKINVNSFHNFGIPHKKMSTKLEVIALDKDDNVEIFKHKKKKIYGFMWHPERNKSYKQLEIIMKRLKIK
tara:strand:- start:165 stop:770 length:606 start_codon:yes stop_codon:yes gene_type:complete